MKGGPRFVLPLQLPAPGFPSLFRERHPNLGRPGAGWPRFSRDRAFRSALRLLKRYPTVLLGYSTISSPALSSFKRTIPTKKIGIGENFSLPGSDGQSFPALSSVSLFFSLPCCPVFPPSALFHRFLSPLFFLLFPCLLLLCSYFSLICSHLLLFALLFLDRTPRSMRHIRSAGQRKGGTDGPPPGLFPYENPVLLCPADRSPCSLLFSARRNERMRTIPRTFRSGRQKSCFRRDFVVQ